MEFLFAWIPTVVLAALIASRRGHIGLLRQLWCLLFGPFALVYYAAIPVDQAVLDKRALLAGEKRACDACLGLVPPGAQRCRHCGESFGDAWQAADPQKVRTAAERGTALDWQRAWQKK